MRCIFGLARPDRGEVRWDGQPVDRDARLRFGYMPEQRGLYPRMRVGEQLSYFAQQHGLAWRDGECGGDRAGWSGWASATGRSRSSRSCRTATSSASSWPSRWPTIPSCSCSTSRSRGLDPIGIATMTEVVHERAAAGVGVVFSSHQLDLVEDVCEDVVIIARGRIVAAGAIDELKARVRAGGISRSRSSGRTAPGSTARGGLTVLERDGDRVKLLVARRRRPRRAARAGARPPARSGRSPTSRRSCPSCSWRPVAARADAVPESRRRAR